MTPLLHTPEQAARWLRDRVTNCLSTDSRKVGPGDGFIAWPGAATDGRQYLGDVLAAGARACLIEREGARAFGFEGERVATYAGLKAASGPIAAAYFEAPSQYLQVVAVTGTNGKTSTAWWLAQALGKLGRKCGVVGTLGIGEPGAMVSNGMTTPDPVLLQQQLRRFVDVGFVACVLEASSIGLVERRLEEHHPIDQHRFASGFLYAPFLAGFRLALTAFDERRRRQRSDRRHHSSKRLGRGRECGKP